MRQFFSPAEAPLWLRGVLGSIREALSDIWATALRLKDYTTANLPPAADWKQGLVYDSTTTTVKYSDGTNWTAFSNSGHTHTENEILLGATDRLVGRDTAGAGAAEEITVGNGLEFTGAGGIGIANDGVTYARIQNVSATDKVLGRSTAGAGDVEEIACTAAGRALIDDADAAAQRTTLGLGTAAVKNTGTSGNNVPLLDGANTWSSTQAFSSGVIDLTGSASNWLMWAQTGIGAPTFNTRSSGTKLVFYPEITNATVDYGIGVDGGRLWLSVPSNSVSHSFYFYGATTLIASLSGAGNLDVIGEYRVDATKVVGNRATGWAAATGTATRTTFDTTTVTTAQLAERVKALIDDLITHGLIGT